MKELDLSRFIFDKHQMEFGTLDSEIAKGTMEIIPADFKRKINFLEDSTHTSKRPILTDKQNVSSIFYLQRQKDSGRHDELE